MTKKLDGAALAQALADLPGWSEVEGRAAITKGYRFADFNAAFAFLSRLALLAERMDHHAEIFNVYDRVAITLSTHDVNGVSERDLRMAAALDDYAEALDAAVLKR